MKLSRFQMKWFISKGKRKIIRLRTLEKISAENCGSIWKNEDENEG